MTTTGPARLDEPGRPAVTTEPGVVPRRGGETDPTRRHRTAPAAAPPRGPGGGPSGPAGRRPPSRPGVPSGTRHRRTAVDELARAVALLWLEVESGRRRPAAVAGLLDHALWHRLRGRWVRGGAPGRLVRILVEHHSPTLCDVAAVVRRGDRAGALSFRLQRRYDGWCVVDAGLPETDGAA